MTMPTVRDCGLLDQHAVASRGPHALPLLRSVRSTFGNKQRSRGPCILCAFASSIVASTYSARANVVREQSVGASRVGPIGMLSSLDQLLPVENPRRQSDGFVPKRIYKWSYKRASGSNVPTAPGLLDADEAGLKSRFLLVCAAQRLGAASAHALYSIAVKDKRLPIHNIRRLREWVGNYKVLASMYSEEIVSCWVCTYPPILRTPPKSLQASLQTLEALLGLAMRDVLDVGRLPSVITVPPAKLLSNYTALRAVFGFPNDAFTAMLIAVPALLASRPDLLALKWSLIQTYCSRHRPWLDALKKASPKSVAVTLTYGKRRYLRFEYLQQHSLQASMSLFQVLQITDKKFTTIHPGFTRWREIQKSEHVSLQEKKEV